MKLASILLFSVLLSAAHADLEIQPSPPSVGADVPVTYFGPPPSSVQKELIGPYQLLKSGTIDLQRGTITLPLYRGSLNGNSDRSIWYIITDTTDAENAAALGINFSAKLKYAKVGNATRWARQLADGSVRFDRQSLVDFSPVLSVTPGSAPNFFPPTSATPGSRANNENRYTPLFFLENTGDVYNGPVIAAATASADDLYAYCGGLPPRNTAAYTAARRILHDKVVSICPRNSRGEGDNTVTLSLTQGFSFARPVLYLSTESSDEVTAALEQATFAPGLRDIEVGGDDSFISAVERLFAVTNGYTNADFSGPGTGNHPSRQGFNSALRGDGGPLNVLGGIPTVATDYSPLWDVNLGRWTDASVQKGYRVRWLEEFQILGFATRGFITKPDGSPFGSSGIIVNCPIAQRLL